MVWRNMRNFFMHKVLQKTIRCVWLTFGLKAWILEGLGSYARNVAVVLTILG